MTLLSLGWPQGLGLGTPVWTPILSSPRLYALLSSRGKARDFTINTGSDLPLGLAVLGHELGLALGGCIWDPDLTLFTPGF